MANPTATFDTSLGSFTAEIFLDQMPITANNFIKLAKKGFYDGLHFHRVINGFMIQFGCEYSKDPNEPALRHRQLAARQRAGRASARTRRSRTSRARCRWRTPGARTRAARSSSSTRSNNSRLDWFSPGPSRHPVFGKITSGMDVVKKIETTPTLGGRPAAHAGEDEQGHDQRALSARAARRSGAAPSSRSCEAPRVARAAGALRGARACPDERRDTRPGTAHERVRIDIAAPRGLREQVFPHRDSS